MHACRVAHTAEPKDLLASCRTLIDTIRYEKSECRGELFYRPRKVAANTVAVSQQTPGTVRYRDAGAIGNVLGGFTDDRRVKGPLGSN